MEFSREGTSTNKPPLLDGSNYAYWNVRMIAFPRVVDDQIRDIIHEG